MEQNRNKDKWVEEIISSAESIKRAEAGPYIYPKIIYRIKNSGNSNNMIPFNKAAFGIVTIILLALLNVFAVFTSVNDTGSKMHQKKESSLKSSEDQLIPSQVNPYLEILNN